MSLHDAMSDAVSEDRAPWLLVELSVRRCALQLEAMWTSARGLCGRPPISARIPSLVD